MHKISRTFRVRRCLAAAWQALVLLAFLLFAAAVHAEQAKGKPPPVRVAVMACTEVLKTFKRYQPLVSYLERRLHRRVALVVPKELNDLERLVREENVEFTFQAPHTYVQMSSFYNRDLLLKALTPEGREKHRGAIIVRNDSPLRRVEELKGYYILFGAENDMAKSLAIRRLLIAKGLDPEKDLRGFRNDGSCESVALNLFLKNVDAGAVCDYSIEEINSSKQAETSGIPPSQFRVLGMTEEVPTWVFAVRDGVAPELAERVIEALRALSPDNPEHEAILESAEIGGFTGTVDSNYDEVRQIMQSMR